MAILNDITGPYLPGIPSMYFNNTYDSDTVNKITNKYKSELYIQCLNSQKKLCGLEFINGLVRSFKIDNELNSKAGLPKNTFSNILTETFLTQDAEMMNVEKRANKADVYDLLDMARLNTIFRKKILFFIDKYLFIKLKIITYMKNTYIAIIPNINEGISYEKMTEFINNNASWTIIASNNTNYLYKEDNPIVLLDSINYGIKDEAFINDDRKGHNKITTNNFYYVGINEDTTNINLLSLSTSIKEKKVDTNNNKIFRYSLPKEYINSIINFSKIECVIFNENNIKNIINLGLTRSFSLPLDKNPIPPQNILVFKQNSTNKTLVLLPSAEVELYYPNVYNIKNINNNDNLVLITYYYDNIDTEFINPIQNYINYIGEESFRNNSINNTLPQPLNDYIPNPAIFSIDDYFKSIEYLTGKNPENYILRKNMDFINDDSNKYNDIAITEKKLTDHYITDYYIDNSNINAFWKNPSISNNFNHCKIESNKRTFTNPMKWFCINKNTDLIANICIFINGIYTIPDYIVSEGFNQYIYINENKFITNNNVFITVIHPENKQFSSELLFTSVNNPISFPIEFDHFSDRNLTFYEKDNNHRLNNSIFRYSTYIGLDFSYLLTKQSEFLLSNTNEYIMTSNYVNLIKSNTFFYKNIDTRTFEMNVLCTEDIMNISVINNIDIIKNPAKQKIFKEPMTYIVFDGFKENDIIYPINVEINGVFINNIERFIEKNINNKYKLYLYIPKSILTLASIISIQIIHAKNMEILEKQLSFNNLPQVKISTIDPQILNKNIIVSSNDIYDKRIIIGNNKTLLWNDLGVLDTSKDRFRVFEIINGTYNFIDPIKYSITFNSFNILNSNATFTFIDDINLKEFYVEYLPYKSDVICRITKQELIDNNYIIDIKDLINKPVNIDNNTLEIYFNGIRIDSSKLKSISPNIIDVSALSSINNTDDLIFIERSHDSDIYGMKYRDYTLEEKIMKIDTNFFNYMKNK